ncbi:MAG: hypothetical protein AAB772_00980 [Patescibacteria group bacterium]
MTFKLSLTEKLIWLAAPLVLFMFFLSVFLYIQLSRPQLSSADDPAYHLAHSVAYITGEQLLFPVFSTMSTHYADLYYWYHSLLALFLNFFGFDINNYLSLIAGAKIFHSILSAFFLTVFFLIARDVIKREVAMPDRRNIILFSLVATLILFFIIPSFTFRLFVYRPHIIAMIFVLAASYFSYRRSVFGVSIVSFFLPFFYSLALVVLIPPFIHGVSSVLHNGINKLKIFENIKKFRLFLFASVSLIAGIFIRPDSLNYLYNGFYITLLTLFNLFFRGIDNIIELTTPIGNINILAIPFFIVCGVYYGRIRHIGLKQAFKFERFYLFILSQVFFVLMIVINRASEYAAPMTVLFLTTVFAGSIIPVLKRLYAGEFDAFFPGAALTEIVIAAKQFLIELARRKKNLLRVFWAIVGLNVVVPAVFFMNILQQEPAPDMYKGAAEFMRDNSRKGDIVFQQRFDMYPRLVFFNQNNRYITGMAETFTYAYNPDTFWLWKHIIMSEPVCPRKKCDKEQSLDIYTVIKDVFKAKYVFIDASKGIGNYPVLNTPDFTALLKTDVRFKKVFVDHQYQDIMVFEL